MQRNYPKPFSGPYGTAEVNGAESKWFVTFGGNTATLEYKTRAEACDVAGAWVNRGLYPRFAQTLVDVVVPATPAGSWR